MKREYLLMVVVGFFILGYILDAVITPLTLALPTPYHFFTRQNLTLYPITAISIILKGLVVSVGMLIIIISLGIRRFAKGSILLVSSVMLQLYALQNVATGSAKITLEWSLGLALAGLLLLIPTLVFFFSSFFERPSTPESAPFESSPSRS